MLSLFSEVHFWTLREEIGISNSDFGAFRYYDKKSNEDTVAFEGKRSYAEKRGHLWVPQNKRPIRIKENLKELEEHLSQQRIVLCQWRDCSLLQLMFSSGLFVNIVVNIFTGDPVSITFDKFLVGKLLSDYVADVVLTKSHLICSYNDSQLTLVYFSKPTLKRSSPKSFSRLDPRLHTLDLAGPTGRRLERKLACNVSGDMFVVWWHSSHNEVYPWSPVVKDQDRANVLVYGISGLKVDLLCHHRSEFDLLSVLFSEIHSNVLRSVEQRVSRNGDVTVESSTYQISRGAMQRTSAASITVPTHVCCHSFSPLQDKLLLGCIDGSLVLYDEALGVTHVVKAAFIPSIVSWHPDNGIFVISNERCQFQILDAALATLKQQLLSEGVSPSNLLDITSYFRNQPTLQTVKWNGKAETNYFGEKFVASDCLLLLAFERGPLAALRFLGGGGLKGDIHSIGGYTMDSLVAQYLWANQVDRAINLLLTLNWDITGSTCLSCLQRIVNYLFKLPLTPDHEVQIQTVLGCFHMPIRPMCPATIDEFRAPVRDLTRRFFHQLLRYKLFEKAFRLAIDLVDRDLFMDIYFSAKKTGQTEIADAAFKKAEELDNSSYTSGSSHSKCSRSSCSDCSESTSMVSDSEDQVSVDTPQKFQSQYKVAENSTGQSEIAIKQNFPPFAENKAKAVQNRPPLPVLTNLNVLGTSGKVDILHPESSISIREKTVIPPQLWERHSLGFQNNTNERDTPLHKVRNHGDSSSPSKMQQVVTSQNERLKVKFCETVTQITLHDRLHTLPEEEEDQQTSYHCSAALPSPVIFPNEMNSQDLKNGNSSLQKTLNPPTRFSHSANSVGIPILLPVPQRIDLPERRNIDVTEAYRLSHHSGRSPSHFPASSPILPPIQWLTSSGSTVVNKPVPQNTRPVPLSTSSSAIPPFYHNGSKVDEDIHRTDVSVSEEFRYVQNKEKQVDVEFNDPLGMEELSALLPGSRKPLASTSSSNSFENSLFSVSVSKGSQNPSTVESNYVINYNSSVHDLSEEEENNGSIKIVHFGVV